MENKARVLAILILGLFLVVGCTQDTTTSPVDTPTLGVPASGNEDVEERVVNTGGEVKEFNVIAYQWGFEPSTITVNKGDKVKITATSRDVPHGFAIDEYGINLYLDGLRPKTVEFTADKAGTFTYYCNIPCGAGHSGMRGKLIVE